MPVCLKIFSLKAPTYRSRCTCWRCWSTYYWSQCARRCQDPKGTLPPLGTFRLSHTNYQLILPFEALYGVTLCLIKTSIVSFYLRIFGTSRNFRISAYVAIGILIAWAFSVILETFLLCRPLAYNWDTTIDGVCGERNKVYVSAGALNVITDFMVMALPVPHILSLQLKIKKKMGLILMFSLGILFVTTSSLAYSRNTQYVPQSQLTICSITIISIIRIKSLETISFTDPTYTLPMGLLWTTLEPCLCIINANLPMTRTYFTTKFPTLFPTSSNRTYGTSEGAKRMQSGSFGGIKMTRMTRDNFEMLGGDQNFGTKSSNKVTVKGGSEVDSIESQKQLTMGANKNQIVVGRSVDIESL